MIKLKLNADIYSKKSVEQVISVYKDYAQIVVKMYQKVIIVEFYDCKYDEKQTLQEFENYLIGLETSYENN